MICQYCGGENVETAFDRQDSVIDKQNNVLALVRSVYWQNFRGIGKSSEAIEFTDALGKALGEYKGDGA
jgi:hypothetical protein